MSRLGETATFALAVLERAAEHDVKYPAAAFAYYGFVAFLPLLVLAVSLLGETVVSGLDETLPQLLTPETRRLVYESQTAASGRTGATAFGVAVLAWSVANMTVSFQTIVERVEGGPDRSYRAQIRDAAGILGSLLLAVCAVVFTEQFLATLPDGPFVTWGRTAVLFVALTVTFLPLYTLSSRVVTGPLAALPGALTAAVGWTTLVAVVQFYAANAAQYALYGVLSGVILVYTSLYAAAAVLMLGVVVNATFVERGVP